MKTLTIFTPTYNRAYILPKLYESLYKENCHDFVWMVVDDGSTDNTCALFDRWILENRIDIQYIKIENGGKMRAHNYGVKICNTPLFFCIDSDDQISTGAIENIISYYDEIKNDDSVCGFIAKKRMDTYNFSRTIPANRSFSLSGLYDSGFTGETSLVFKTDIIRKFPFLEVEGEKFSTEGYAYLQIDQKYVYRTKDEFWTDCMYQPDGYTMNTDKLLFSSPKGWREYFILSYKLKAKSFINKIRTISLYICVSIISRTDIFTILKDSPSKTLVLLCFPLGILIFWKKKYVLTHNNTNN